MYKYKRITKKLWFHLIFKTANLQDIISTTLGDDIKIRINNLYLFSPIFIPNAETQTMFNESLRIKCTILFDSWYTGRKDVNDGLEFQVDVGSAQNINRPKYIIAAHQFLAKIGVPNKFIAVFDTLDVGKFFSERDGQRYPKDAAITNYIKNDYLHQYWVLKLFYKE